jgi:tetratricopeptide (TPR) repeat protein
MRSSDSGRRPGTPTTVVVVVAVLIGLGVGRFLTAGADEPAPPSTVAVAAAPDVAGRIGQLERATASDPTDLASLQALAAAYVDRAAESGDASFYAQAERALARAQELRPDDPDTMLVEGILKLALHEFDDALAVGQRALAQRPDTAAVLGVVVDAQVELGNYDAAGETLQRMLDRRPGLPALARASYLRELSGDLTGAVTAMQQAVAAGSTSAYDEAVVLSLLGDLFFLQGDVDAAAMSYDDALAASPELVDAVLGATRVRAARGDVPGAIASLDELTRTRPTVGGLTLLRELQVYAGDEQAAQDATQVLRSVATLQEAAGQVVDLEMALVEADAGNAAAALRFARAAHAARPDNVFVNDALAWALLADGQARAAVPHVEQALRLGTADPLLRYHAAEVFAAAGDLDRARTELAAVLEVTPWFSFGHLRAAADLAGRLGVPAPPQWTTAT